PEAAEALCPASQERDREVAEVEREEIRRDAQGTQRRSGERLPNRPAQVRGRRIGREREEAEREEDRDRARGDGLGLTDEMRARDQPNGASPWRVRNDTSQRTASTAETVATATPSTTGPGPSCWNIDGPPCRRLPARSCRQAAPSVGSPRRNENSAAATASRPSSIPPAMVTIDRDVPGQSASVWKSPIPRAVRKDIAVRSFSPRPSRRPSQIIHTPPAASAASTGPGLKSAALIALLSSTPARAAGTKASATFQ